jgi:ribosomal protein S16
MAEKSEGLIEELEKDVPVERINTSPIETPKTKKSDPVQSLLEAGKDLYEEDDYIVERLGITFKIRNFSDDELEVLNERVSKWLSVGGQVQKDANQTRLRHLIIIEGTIDPSWKDPRMIEKYKTSEAAVRAILRPGEITEYAGKILEMSGFVADIVDRIKKS